MVREAEIEQEDRQVIKEVQRQSLGQESREQAGREESSHKLRDSYVVTVAGR